MKKAGTFFLSFVPFLISIALQFVIVFYFLIIGAIFLLGIGPMITKKTYDIDDLMVLAADMNFNTVIMITFSVTCIVTFGIWYYKSCGGEFKPNVKKTFHPLELLGIVFLIPGSQFLSSIVTSVVSLIFPSWLEAYEQLIESAGLTEDISILMMIYSVILAPISEELVFRGVTLRIAQRAFPFWFANILQAFLFGAFHMNWLQGCYTFVLGLILGYICEKGGSIYHVIFFHFLFNLWGTTAAEWLLISDPLVQGIFIIVGTILGLSLGFFFFYQGRKAKTLKIKAAQ